MTHTPHPRLDALRAAFPLTIPIALGFLFLGCSYGMLMATKGFPFTWPMLTAAVIYAGSMEFLTANLLTAAYNPTAAILLALMVNARHLFYGLSMLDKFKGLGWKRPYLIYGMCDETYAINSTTPIPAHIDRGWFYLWTTLLNQTYWITGATLGGIIGNHLPLNTQGLDFVLTALFLVILLDQWHNAPHDNTHTDHTTHASTLIGTLTTLTLLTILGPDRFMIPSLITMLAIFTLLKPKLDQPAPTTSATTGANPPAPTAHATAPADHAGHVGQAKTEGNAR